MLTKAELTRIWHYDPLTGLFTRLVKTNSNCQVGDVAKCHEHGYITIRINSKLYKAHRLAWLYMTGEWPKHQIDHKFGIRDDNRWSELRDVTQSVNQQNQRNSHKDGTSGYAGVSWNKAAGKWEASIRINNKKIYLGYFDCKHQAGAYRLQRKRELHEGCTI